MIKNNIYYSRLVFLIEETKNLGFQHYSPLKGKEIIIEKYYFEKVTSEIIFILKSKFEEKYEIRIEEEKIELFLKNFSLSPPPIKIICETEKEIKKDFENLVIGFSKNYEDFVIARPLVNKFLKTLDHLNYSFFTFGYLSPILVLKKDNKLYILDGRKRFEFWKKNNLDIFYLDIGSFYKNYITIKWISDVNLVLNEKRGGIKLVNIWEELCRHNVYYRQLNIFIREKEVTRYIEKFNFILLFENKWEDLINYKANFDNKEYLLFVVKRLPSVFPYLAVKNKKTRFQNELSLAKFLKNKDNLDNNYLYEKFKLYEGDWKKKDMEIFLLNTDQ